MFRIKILPCAHHGRLDSDQREPLRYEKKRHRLVGHGEDRALEGATYVLKQVGPLRLRAARSADEQHPVAAESGADQSDQAQSQQDPMQPLDESEGRFRPGLGASA